MLCVKLSGVPAGHGCRSGLIVSDSVLHCAETGGDKEKVINHRALVESPRFKISLQVRCVSFSERLSWKLGGGDTGCSALIPTFKQNRITQELHRKCLSTPHDAPGWLHLCDSGVEYGRRSVASLIPEAVVAHTPPRAVVIHILQAPRPPMQT